MKVDPGRLERYSRAGWRWIRLLPPRRRRGLRVFYGDYRVPGPASPSRADRRSSSDSPRGSRESPLPASRSSTPGSTWLPRDLGPLLGLARRRSIPVVVNMDGVAYPGWAGERTEELNEPDRRALGAATHCPYESEFSKSSADEFLDAPPGPGRSSTTPSTRNDFTPAAGTSAGRARAAPRGGDQTQAYRLELGLRTFARVLESEPFARLLVTGRLVFGPSRSSTSSACAAWVDRRVGDFLSARRLTSCAARTSCCTRRCTSAPEGAW